jgi:hypothetical protein
MHSEIFNLLETSTFYHNMAGKRKIFTCVLVINSKCRKLCISRIFIRKTQIFEYLVNVLKLQLNLNCRCSLYRLRFFSFEFTCLASYKNISIKGIHSHTHTHTHIYTCYICMYIHRVFTKELCGFKS